MKQINLLDKYPINRLEIKKEKGIFHSVDEILESLKSKIDTHPIATYIATFDHYGHTRSLQDGNVASNILDAKNIVCCFGKDLSDPSMLAVRPRSIGVVELNDSFVVSFMDAPNPQAHDAMVSWVESLKINKGE